MNDGKTELGRKILKLKKAKGLKWSDVAARIGMSPVWTCALCMGHMSAEPRHARGVGGIHGRGEVDGAALSELPNRGAPPLPPPPAPKKRRTRTKKLPQQASKEGTTDD